MEEKERYVYHEVSNEVEQYECYYDTEECYELFDDKDILNRLNQQDKRIKELENENKQLKKQLAEKTLTIEQINKAFIENRSLWKGKYEQSNQDKISFAVEQLEKVKEKLLEELQNVTDLLDPLEYEDYHEFIGCGRGYKNSIEEIDNQIKELKEMFNEK